MSKILITGREAVRILGTSTTKFLQLQDEGKIIPELFEGGTFYNLSELRKINFKARTQPVEFPENKYTSATKAMEILEVSRRTFYNRVNSGEIKLHKKGTASFVKLTDLYADKELF